MTAPPVGSEEASTDEGVCPNSPSASSAPEAGFGAVSGGAVVRRGVGSGRAPGEKTTIESVVSTGSQAEYFKPEQTIILLDWDDTLCPSTWIRSNRGALSFFKPAPNIEKHQVPLRKLEANCEALLRSAMQLGTVIIVTNAMEPWVETSSRHFLPGLLPLVHELPVIYARSVYETHACDPAQGEARGRAAMPGMYDASGRNLAMAGGRVPMQRRSFDEAEPQRWKELVFEQEISGFYSRYAKQSWKNILSIGDSIFERDAVRNVVLQRPTPGRKCRTKTLKLFDNPGIEELIEQVRLVHEGLHAMVQHDGELNIEIDEADLRTGISIPEKLQD